MFCLVSFFLMMTMMKRAVAPMAPASVGLMKPRYMPPMTMQKTSSTSQTPLRAINLSLKVTFSVPRGASFGFMATRTMTHAMNAPAMTAPGRIPEMRSFPMDCSVSMP